MIARFTVSGILALSSIIVPLAVGAEWSLSLPAYGGVFAAPVALVALILSRRWPGDRLLFRKRRIDERERQLLSATDSVSVTLFVAFAGLAAVVFVVLWILAPRSFEADAIKELSHAIGVAANVSLISRSLMTLVVLHSTTGIWFFTRE